MSEPKRIQSCRTCEHLRVHPNAKGVAVARKGKVYPCAAPVPEVQLPDSVAYVYGFAWPPRGRSHMEPDAGATCPAWVRRNLSCVGPPPRTYRER